MQFSRNPARIINLSVWFHLDFSFSNYFSGISKNFTAPLKKKKNYISIPLHAFYIVFRIYLYVFQWNILIHVAIVNNIFFKDAYLKITSNICIKMHMYLYFFGYCIPNFLCAKWWRISSHNTKNIFAPSLNQKKKWKGNKKRGWNFFLL